MEAAHAHLFHAIEHNDLAAFQDHARSHPTFSFREWFTSPLTGYRTTLLIQACLFNKPEIVEFLVQNDRGGINQREPGLGICALQAAMLRGTHPLFMSHPPVAEPEAPAPVPQEEVGGEEEEEDTDDEDEDTEDEDTDDEEDEDEEEEEAVAAAVNNNEDAPPPPPPNGPHVDLRCAWLLLIQGGADPNAVSSTGVPLIIQVFRADRIDALHLLMGGPAVEVQWNCGVGPNLNLMSAARAKEEAALQENLADEAQLELRQLLNLAAVEFCIGTPQEREKYRTSLGWVRAREQWDPAVEGRVTAAVAGLYEEGREDLFDGICGWSSEELNFMLREGPWERAPFLSKLVFIRNGITDDDFDPDEDEQEYIEEMDQLMARLLRDHPTSGRLNLNLQSTLNRRTPVMEALIYEAPTLLYLLLRATSGGEQDFTLKDAKGRDLLGILIRRGTLANLVPQLLAAPEVVRQLLPDADARRKRHDEASEVLVKALEKVMETANADLGQQQEAAEWHAHAEQVERYLREWSNNQDPARLAKSSPSILVAERNAHVLKFNTGERFGTRGENREAVQMILRGNIAGIKDYLAKRAQDHLYGINNRFWHRSRKGYYSLLELAVLWRMHDKISFLLGQPGVNVNAPSFLDVPEDSLNPLARALEEVDPEIEGSRYPAVLILRAPGVDPNYIMPGSGRTILVNAINDLDYGGVACLLAYAKNLNLHLDSEDRKLNARLAAEYMEQHAPADQGRMRQMITDYRNNPGFFTRQRDAVVSQYHLHAGDVLALTLATGEDYFRLTEAEIEDEEEEDEGMGKRNDARRFFRAMLRLPLELQMFVSNITAKGEPTAKIMVPGWAFERAFKATMADTYS